MNRCPNCGGTVKNGACEYCDTVLEKPALNMEVLYDEPFVISLPIRGTERRVYFKVRCESADMSVETSDVIDVTTLLDTRKRFVSNNSIVLDLKLRVLDKVD